MRVGPAPGLRVAVADFPQAVELKGDLEVKALIPPVVVIPGVLRECERLDCLTANRRLIDGPLGGAARLRGKDRLRRW